MCIYVCVYMYVCIYIYTGFSTGTHTQLYSYDAIIFLS